MEFDCKIKELNNIDIKHEIDADESHVDDFYVEIPTTVDNQEEKDGPDFWESAEQFEKANILKEENKLLRQKLEKMGVYHFERLEKNAGVAYIIDLTDINVVCRICLKRNQLLESVDGILSFENPGINSISILNALQSLGLDPISIEDHLPNKICPECIQYLKLLTMFKYTYEKSFEILRVYTETLKKGNENVNKNVNFVTTSTIKEEINNSYEEYEANEEEIFADVKSPKNNSSMQLDKTKQYKKPHKCPICFENLTLSQFRPHIRKHTALKKYLNAAKVEKNVKYYALPSNRVSLINEENMLHKCPFCPESFEATTFLTHMNDHLKNDQFACDKCNRVFMKRSYLVQHKLVHMKELPYRCKTCGKQFVSKGNYDYHLLGHADGELPYKCEFCSKKFSNPLHLKRHKTIHLENISYSDKYRMKRCSGCLQSFVNETEFQSHVCMWSGNRVRHCRFCRQPFNKLQNHSCSKLIMHKKAVAQKKKYQCSICNKMVGNITFHKMSAHPETVQKSLCSDCGLYVVNIYQHRMKHKRTKCNICDKEFSSSSLMKKHQLIHTGQRPFLCTSCPKTFNCKYNLQVHERIHTGNKCHVCHVCDKGFLEKSYLNKHLKTHKYVM
ncbi:unnamed protein product [Phyllotreta striolata]|uniref:Uncharacterized protein n=1 Tax=Phyllotreta striolata TaxID=444603 RepID=A0A9N9TW02_PHYSR|nr:unnamed protein product [Phyllotreta striolata]